MAPAQTPRIDRDTNPEAAPRAHQRVHPYGARGSGRRALTTRTVDGRAQVDRAFATWLPAEVACAPGIRWDRLPAHARPSSPPPRGEHFL